MLSDRIKEIRKSKGLKQSQMADIFGVKAGTVTSWETGVREPSDAIIKSICREFDVNEEWLRTGKGEMFVPITRDEEIEDFIGRLLHDEPDSFRKRLVSVLAKLTEEEWAILEEKARWLVNGDPENEKGG